MKKPAKILTLLLAVLLALGTFVACDKKAADDTANEEEAVREVVEEFADAFCDGDFEGTKEFMNEDAAEEMEEESKAFEENLSSELSRLEEMGMSSQQIESFSSDLVDAVMNLALKNMEVEIIEIKIDGETAKAEVEVVMPDGEDFSEGMATAMGSLLTTDEAFMEDFMAYATSKYTEDELSVMSEAEQKELVGGFVAEELMPKAIDSINDLDCKTTTEEHTIELEKDGDSWLISEMPDLL